MTSFLDNCTMTRKYELNSTPQVAFQDNFAHWVTLLMTIFAQRHVFLRSFFTQWHVLLTAIFARRHVLLLTIFARRLVTFRLIQHHKMSLFWQICAMSRPVVDNFAWRLVTLRLTHRHKTPCLDSFARWLIRFTFNITLQVTFFVFQVDLYV